MSDVARITVTVDVLMKDGSSQSTKYTADTSVEPFNIEEQSGRSLADMLFEMPRPSECDVPKPPKPIRLKIEGQVFCLERSSKTAPEIGAP